MNAFGYEITGLKCDAVGCGYFDASVTSDQYERWLNHPCPKCGASLLTEKDLATVKLLIATADWFSAQLGPAPEDAEIVNINLKMDGSGFVEFPPE